MISSMTGFGKGTAVCPYGKISVEIKTLNHKSLSISCNPFNGFFLLEERMKQLFENKIHRGKAFIRVTMESAGEQKDLQKITVNQKAAKEYLKKINKAKKDLKLGGEITINDIINFPGVLETSEDKKEEKLWPHIKAAVEKAVGSLITYRRNEGVKLARDFDSRLKKIKIRIREIRKSEKKSIEAYRKKVKESVLELSASAGMDKNRIEAEVALFAKNCDIAEEITRLDAHIEAYKDAVKKAKADVGKKLDFIAQEMQREINTIGAKSGDLKIAKNVIDVKSEIEKMREQIKNVE
jgi:uncharacterized protein (TIGR00255 family)